jgi:hypothetical protein
MTPEKRMGKRILAVAGRAHTCSPGVRPAGFISCEHMFPPARTSTLAQRALDALRLTRSFLLLEDDHDVDWEVDQDEHSQVIHPHRAPLRGRRGPRRPGQPAAAPHVCLCPIRDHAAPYRHGIREHGAPSSRRSTDVSGRHGPDGQQRL